jgi:hypothetical protein
MTGRPRSLPKGKDGLPSQPPRSFGTKRLFPLIFLLTGLGFSSPDLYALSEFYWENPELFSPGMGNFPVSAYNGELSLVAWQESRDISAADPGDFISQNSTHTSIVMPCEFS